MNNTVQNFEVYCQTEFDGLQQVVVAPPTFMSIKEAINETQKHYLNENIDCSVALEQHDHFVKTLQRNGIEVVELPTDQALNEQVFTRDIGFTIQNRLFLGNMKETVRQPEPSLLKKWCTKHSITWEEELPSPIEGGDVLIDRNTIWIGISNRTTTASIEELRRRFPFYQVKTLELREDILHLDCALNIIDHETAIIYPPAFKSDDYQRLEKEYNLIQTTYNEFFNMGPNVLSIGNKKIISLPENQRLNKSLRLNGFKVIEVEFSEIIKSGGSFRCCTLPLWRE